MGTDWERNFNGVLSAPATEDRVHGPWKTGSPWPPLLRMATSVSAASELSFLLQLLPPAQSFSLFHLSVPSQLEGDSMPQETPVSYRVPHEPDGWMLQKHCGLGGEHTTCSADFPKGLEGPWGCWQAGGARSAEACAMGPNSP